MDQEAGQDATVAVSETGLAYKKPAADPKEQRRLGLAFLQTGQFAEAQGEFESAIAADPKSAELHGLLSVALERQGRTEEAVSAAIKAAQMDEVRQARVAEIYLSVGRPAEADAALRQAISSGHESAQMHHLLSVAFEHQGRSGDAMASARRATELAPDDPRWANRAALLTARAAEATERANVEKARAAERRGDWEEAVILWEQARDAAPLLALNYSSGAAALRHLRRFDEAKDLIDKAVHRFPDDASVLIEYARVAEAKRNWEEARATWDRVIAHFPDRPAGYVGKMAMLRVTGQFAEGEQIGVATIQRFPDEHAPLIEHAFIAQVSRDWAAASRRWEKVREIAPHHVFAYTQGAVAYWEQRRFSDAETVLKDAMQRFPDHATPFMHFADVATKQNEWAEALKRWIYVTEQFPEHPDRLVHIHRMETARMRLLEVDPVAADNTSGRVSAARAEGVEPDMCEVMFAFESLGGQMGGCEFGNVQRAFGAEPLSLLRWAEMGPEQLIDALTEKFEGVGEPENTEVILKDNGGRNEYRTLDRRFGMAMHTFIHEDEVSPEKMYAQSCIRLKYLANKLREDLRAASKIFVYKIASRTLTDDELDRMHAAVRACGDATLLYVRPETDVKKHGTVEVAKPGLMIGYIDQFSVYREGGRLTDQSASWAPICLRAYDLWRQGVPEDVGGAAPTQASAYEQSPSNDQLPPLKSASQRHIAPNSRTRDRGLWGYIRSLFSK
jgi:tetratricopeptide (TPR) repeat protein